MKQKRVPLIRQVGITDCGFACLTMLFNYYGYNIDISELKAKNSVGRNGLSLAKLKEICQENYFQFKAYKNFSSENDLLMNLPAILFSKTNHYVVVSRKRNNTFELLDPVKGKIQVSFDDIQREYMDILVVIRPRKADGSDAAGDNSVERNHGKAIRPYVNLSKPSSEKKDISYEYVPGPFMRMYVKALKNSRTDNIKPFLLIIEEINRANVAAVFGDIFQLLDRGDDFVSEYPIQATEDIKKYLAKELGGNPNDYNKIKIPDNMFIWATMNSADQGVFPMDTAFKRRWDFSYLGIDDSDQDLQGKYVYLADDKSQKVEWNKLRKAINNFLAKEKINEDKQLGPYFISRSIVVPEDGDEIDRERFINTFKNKVIMYLFEDAAKQKRFRLFEGCFQNSSRYSEICREFEAKGVGIFNHDIQLDCEVEDVKSGDTPQE